MTKRVNHTPPHYRLTLKDVLRDYEDGLLTVKGAIFYAVSSSRKLGEFVRLNPIRFGGQLGVSRASIYRSIAELKEQSRIDFEIEGAYLLKVPIKDGEDVPLYIFLRELSQKVDSLSQKVDKKSQKVDSLSTFLDEKKSEPALEADSEALQSIQSLQSLLSSQAKGIESEDLANDPEFRLWLNKKADLLPTRPALKEMWLEKNAQLEANQREYLEYRNTLQRAIIPENLPLEEITNQAEYWKRVQERSDNP